MLSVFVHISGPEVNSCPPAARPISPHIVKKYVDFISNHVAPHMALYK